MNELYQRGDVFLHREGVMEFLLVNHPLDCPICDQGGECDLQVSYKLKNSVLSLTEQNVPFLMCHSINLFSQLAHFSYFTFVEFKHG